MKLLSGALVCLLIFLLPFQVYSDISCDRFLLNAHAELENKFIKLNFSYNGIEATNFFYEEFCLYKNGDDVIETEPAKGIIGSYSLFYLNMKNLSSELLENKTWVSSNNCKYLFLTDDDYHSGDFTFINKIMSCSYIYVLRIDDHPDGYFSISIKKPSEKYFKPISGKVVTRDEL